MSNVNHVVRLASHSPIVVVAAFMSSFSLRIPDDLMEEAKKPAAENSTSLNQFFLVTIAAKIG